MRTLSLFALILFTGCGTTVTEDLVTEESPIQEVVGCASIARAWCEHHIECGTVHDNISECMELIQWLYCPSDNSVASEDKSAMCYHDLTTAECGSFEMSWPGSCYDALGFEEGC